MALTQVDRDGRTAIPGARSAATAVQNADVLFSLSVGHESTSSDAGGQAKTQLLAAVKLEYRSVEQLDQGLKAYDEHHDASAKKLINQAATGLRTAAKQSVEAGKAIGALLSSSSTGSGVGTDAGSSGATPIG